MDSSREADLSALHKRFQDTDLPMGTRQQAYRTFQTIQSQVKDKGLNELRHRLIRAHRANDVHEAEKIEQQLKEYSYRHGYQVKE